MKDLADQGHPDLDYVAADVGIVAKALLDLAYEGTRRKST
jgi:hypothetical protein